MQSIQYLFISHILRYVGIGLISGSLVHAGTLGGSFLKYIILVIMGIVFFSIGTFMENRKKIDKNLLSFLLISVVVSIGTGMISGGTQHYLDKPTFGSIIIPLGLCIAYLAFIRQHNEKITVQKIVYILLFSVLVYGGLYMVSQLLHTLPVRGH